MTQRMHNFSPGPAVLPEPVLRQIANEMMSLPGLGMSVLEISHRSPEFISIHEQAQANLRRLLDISNDYQILFLQGGSRLQFAMIPMNLAAHQPDSQQLGQYFVTGTWSKKAAEEAQKYVGIPTEVICNFADSKFDRLPAEGSYKINPKAAYAYYCSNETVQGVQFLYEPNVGDVPLVCDASSDFLCRPLPIDKYGLIYACAQKNAGPAGVTIVVMRKELLERSDDAMPSYLNFKTQAAEDSMYNTPPTFAIYVVKLVTEWLLDEIGGLDKMFAQNQLKSEMLYEVVDQFPSLYHGHAQRDSRSIMNVTFRLPNDELQAKFLSEAKTRQLLNLKGHRSVGGIRASIYNALPISSVTALRDFMQDFAQANG